MGFKSKSFDWIIWILCLKESTFFLFFANVEVVLYSELHVLTLLCLHELVNDIFTVHLINIACLVMDYLPWITWIRNLTCLSPIDMNNVVIFSTLLSVSFYYLTNRLTNWLLPLNKVVFIVTSLEQKCYLLPPLNKTVMCNFPWDHFLLS